jgi:hypothetical protein
MQLPMAFNVGQRSTLYWNKQILYSILYPISPPFRPPLAPQDRYILLAPQDRNIPILDHDEPISGIILKYDIDTQTIFDCR